MFGRLQKDVAEIAPDPPVSLLVHSSWPSIPSAMPARLMLVTELETAVPVAGLVMAKPVGRSGQSATSKCQSSPSLLSQVLAPSLKTTSMLVAPGGGA